MEKELIPKFVLTPYITPLPIEIGSNNYSNLIITDTLQTLFPGFESPYIINPNDLYQMFDNLEQNIPKMVNLQTDVLEPGPKPNLHSGNISLWIRFLADPSYHLFSLNPVPSFEHLTLDALIFDCIQYKLPPDRAAWAIHKYVIEKDISPKVLTHTIISDPKYLNNDLDFFAKFCYALYTRNLLQHSLLIKWMIQEMKPNHLKIFKKELLKTHSLLYYAFQTEDADKYIQFFKKDLLLNKSQLVQFAIISQIRENTFEKYLIPLLRDDVKHRSRLICDLALPRLAFSSVIRNLLFLEFPYFNIDNLANDVKKMVHFSNDEELTEHVLDLCKAVLWFNSCLPSVSVVVSYLINILVIDYKRISFPLSEFIDILFDNYESVDHFQFLFAELQNYKLFNYSDYLKLILQKAYLLEKTEQTKRVISALPCVAKNAQTLMKLHCFLNRVFPENNIQNTLKQVFNGLNYLHTNHSNMNEDSDVNNSDVNNDMNHTKELMNELPYVLKYQLALYITDHPESFNSAAKLANYLGAPNLILNLFKTYGNEDIYISMEILPVIKEMIPAFATKDLLEKLTFALLSAPSKPGNFEVLMFLIDHYKSLRPLSKFKSQFTEITKQSKIVSISKEQILSLFGEYSYLCSLHVYDALFSVKTVKDFIAVFPIFLSDLLNFPLLSIDDLYTLFTEFSETTIISRSSIMFIRYLISNFVKSPVFFENQRVVELLRHFFAKVLLSRVVDVHMILETLFSLCKKKNVKQPPPQSSYVLMDILINVFEEHKKHFPVDILLTENIVKGFYQAFQQSNNSNNDGSMTNPSPFTSYLTLLRSFEPPIITDNIIKSIESGSQQGMMFAAALFSLLPTAMLSPNLFDVFDYFKATVTRTTSTFWTLWLKLRPYFNQGFPVTLAQPDKEALSSHRTSLISLFSSLLFHAVSGDEKTLVYLNCWTLLCNDINFSQTIIDNTINDLHAKRLSMRPMMITYLHPSLMVINEKTFEQLCEGFCRYMYEGQFMEFTRLASSVFAVFVSRFASNVSIIPKIAEKTLEWIPAIHRAHGNCLEYVIDAFNFIMCFSNDENPQRDDEEDMFLENLHIKIRDNLQKIPDEISDFILLNLPPQIYVQSKEPLYSDYSLPTEPEPPQAFQPQHTYSPPDHNDSGFSNQFDNFQPFDDEFPTWF
ncbi:hypothetical protein TRFO_17262 [Tritrichomonas foetus]|uniref:Uncharacterized protein n=1 Tax=Tritrichomonas foetus TaxID=1144522 RepID=A0A1J4KTI1_9EUKA|nr:hypothetical protein TRFO_17262 [Tritrichomonas foetus]|eukprot:OHT12797.1 hypothetical protein TRFO_17262 [Tritrichomonas foetus]